MRVFCPEHNKSFFAPRQNPLKCGNRGHILGDLDFQGQAKSPAEIRWQYCCNCEHLSPAAQHGIERCPACARQVSGLYLCDQCYTISFESNTPAETKNFTVTSEGMPQPSCPGCLRPGSADLREHTCDELGASFITALTSCPICKERLDIAPSFPASVGYYLKRTKTGNKLPVTFDYDSELFVPIEDGEFVLIRNGNETLQPIILPRSAQFSTRRDFYDFYEDYYHCANPGAGEVQIIEPVTVDPVAGGWKLKAPGILEVLVKQPKKKRLIEVANARADMSHREKSDPDIEPIKQTPPHANISSRGQTQPSIEPMKQECPLTGCSHCGSLVETRYAFCWNCGHQLATGDEASVGWAQEPKAMMLSPAVVTTEQEPRAAYLGGTPIFSRALQEEPDWSKKKAAARKLITLALASSMLVSLSVFLAWRWVLRTSPTAPVTAQELRFSSDPTAGQAGDRNPPTEPTPERNSAANAENDELKRLRDSRLAVGAVSRPDVLKALSAAEKQYPNDYRFPYERAKLAVKADQTHTHSEAFAVLSLAARKALDSGKANEMLDSLEADKDSDFHKLSHGHDEWRLLEQALKSKDKKMLVKSI